MQRGACSCNWPLLHSNRWRYLRIPAMATPRVPLPGRPHACMHSGRQCRIPRSSWRALRPKATAYLDAQRLPAKALPAACLLLEPVPRLLTLTSSGLQGGRMLYAGTQSTQPALTCHGRCVHLRPALHLPPPAGLSQQYGAWTRLGEVPVACLACYAAPTCNAMAMAWTCMRRAYHAPPRAQRLLRPNALPAATHAATARRRAAANVACARGRCASRSAHHMRRQRAKNGSWDAPPAAARLRRAPPLRHTQIRSRSRRLSRRSSRTSPSSTSLRTRLSSPRSW